MLLAMVIGVAPAAAAVGNAGGDAGHVRRGGGARVVAEEQVGSRLVDLTVESPALGRTAKVRLLTPDGWNQRRRSDHWPTFYLLHGCCDTYESWTLQTDVEDLAQLRNVLVVMPEAGPQGWYSDWWNHGEGGPPAWETFHTRELRQLLEHDFGAGQKRVIAGLSMGGFGALSYAGRNPGMFRAAASYSGVVHPLYDGWPEGMMGFMEEEFGLDPLALWGDPVAQRGIWQAHDPYYLAKRLRSTYVFLSSGDGTPGPFEPPGEPGDELEAQIYQMNQLLAPRLQQAGVRVTTDFYGPGIHNWPYWERELHRSLPLLLCALQNTNHCERAA
ncbi:alpha/beta hydrolase [Kribbella sp. NPDC051620]|uniref:alpha/beta hydrolase n=1 Tax=Kribbella sp. NPDC051620 TaxID=3364120 RepID=UPI0037992E59